MQDICKACYKLGYYEDNTATVCSKSFSGRALVKSSMNVMDIEKAMKSKCATTECVDCLKLKGDTLFFIEFKGDPNYFMEKNKSGYNNKYNEFILFGSNLQKKFSQSKYFFDTEMCKCTEVGSKKILVIGKNVIPGSRLRILERGLLSSDINLYLAEKFDREFA